MTAHQNSAHYAALLHMRPGDIVFDIGANSVAVTTKLAAVAGHIYAFEPNPFVKQDGLPENVTIIQKAVSNADGKSVFHIDQRPGAHASSLMILQDMEGKTEDITVNTIRLDTFCQTNGVVPNIVKIDVEGMEPNVIEGAQKTITKHRPIIIFELWESHWTRYGPMIEFLNQHYHLAKLATGEPAIPYYSEPRSDIDDVLCIPRDPRDLRGISFKNNKIVSALHRIIRNGSRKIANLNGASSLREVR